MPEASDQRLHEYQRAVRERDRLLTRAAWWDRWQTSLVLPMIVTGAGAGYLLGMYARLLFNLPDKTDFFGAAIGIAAIGRLISHYFNIRKLEVARRRVEALAPGPSPEKRS